MSGFHDIRLPDDISRGAEGGPQYSTTIVSAPGGWEARNQNWLDGRLEWTVGHLLRDPDKIASLIAFFRARKGSANGFRFRDWSDWLVGMAWQANELVYTTPHAFATGDGAKTVFQLERVYTDAGGEERRPITRPAAASVRIYLAGVLQASGYILNASTGQVTFDVAPGVGVAVAWAGQFDVPVRFADDRMNITMLAPHLANWQGIRLVELREYDSA